MSSLGNKLKSASHHLGKRAVRILAPNEISRKRAVAAYYAARTRMANFTRSAPKYTAEELFSWRRTMQLKVNCAEEIYRGNSFYGAGLALREYSGSNLPIKACIEHGLYLGEYVNPIECNQSGLPAVVTFGPARKGHIRRRFDCPVLTVGPYIAYAKDYLDGKEAMHAKQMAGRTLLAFPSHSIEYVEKQYDASGYIDHLKARAREEHFDTVLISLYYSDILRGAADLYEHAGFTVVTCGYREDALFLRRLRSLIHLADETSSNSVGTHIGYCAYFGKPHLVYHQPYKSVGVTRMDDNGALLSVNGAANESAEIVDAFATRAGSVTERQAEICDRYWGFGLIKTAETLAACFEMLEKAFSKGKALSESEIAFFDLASGTGQRNAKGFGVPEE